MCGIAGFYSPSTARKETEARRMIEALRHRGPDDQGVWIDEAAGLALGHARLAVIDVSAAGRQPMVSACGRYVISFNGEIYNFKELRKELEDFGAVFRGRSDTEVMLAAISGLGLEAAVRRFNGMFAFALWDRHARALSLVRDRLGEKPLYYGWMGKTFLFGSELKALHAHPQFKGSIDRNAVAAYLRYSCIPSPHSIYQGIYKLPPGTILTLPVPSQGTLPSPATYWSAKEAAERGVREPFAGSEEEAVSGLDGLLRDAVGLRMEADVPLGAFLSGGIDSSTVAALMQAQAGRPVKTFTIGFNEASHNEAAEAKAVAEHLGTDHTELYATEREALAVIPRLPTLYDEPFADSSQIPTFLVSELARRHVTVSLSGDGGDELFGGYNRYFWGADIWAKVGWLPAGVRGAAASALTALSPRNWDRTLSALGPVLPSKARQRTPGDKLHKLAAVLAADSPEAFYNGLVSQWKNPLAVALSSGELSSPHASAAARSNLKDFSERMMYLDAVSYLPDDILVKLDRASMGVSLESRVPLLDHRVFEFAWRLPLSMKIRGGSGKWLLRRVLNRYVPSELTARPKMGFALPIGDWLRGPLRDWAEELLDERRLREEGFFDPAAIREKWSQHLSGGYNWQHPLWGILMFEAWLEKWE